jgi:hypothetical protein
MENDPDKVKLAKEAGQIFSDQFGPDDIYKSILFEVFLEELKLKKEQNANERNQNMDLPDETGQERS